MVAHLEQLLIKCKGVLDGDLIGSCLPNVKECLDGDPAGTIALQNLKVCLDDDLAVTVFDGDLVGTVALRT